MPVQLILKLPKQPVKQMFFEAWSKILRISVVGIPDYAAVIFLFRVCGSGSAKTAPMKKS
jgi:hypothetical protein